MLSKAVNLWNVFSIIVVFVITLSTVVTVNNKEKAKDITLHCTHCENKDKSGSSETPVSVNPTLVWIEVASCFFDIVSPQFLHGTDQWL